MAFANLQPPSRWRSNVKEVRRAAQARHFRITGEVSVQSRHWRFGSLLPLGPALRVRDKYALADDITRALAGLHYHAHPARGFEESAFLLAKALELARKVLPGQTDVQRDASLPAQVRASLELSLHALYDLFEHAIRHAPCRCEERKSELESTYGRRGASEVST